MVVPSWSHVRLFATPWTTGTQGSSASTISPNLFRFMSLCWWCYLTILYSAAQFSSAFHLSQHQGLFLWVSFSHQMAKILEVQQSFQWIFTFSLSSVHSLSCVWLFAITWTAACQVSLSITNPQNFFKFISIESVMPSNHFILYHLLLLPTSVFPIIRSFQMNQFFISGGRSIRVSASASVLPMNTQDWSPLGWTGWISLQSKGLSRVFSNTTVQKHQFFGTQLTL